MTEKEETMKEVFGLIEDVLDTLIEVGNGTTDEMLHEAADELFRARDLLKKTVKDQEQEESEMEMEILKPEPCEDAWIIDSLKEFLGESYSVLTSDKKEFTSWLERLRWHVAKCNELGAELRNYKKQVECENAISREDALMCMTGEFLPFVLYKPEDIISKRIQRIKDLPPVQPKIRTGKWIYRNYNWYCSECENAPKTLGYVGTAEFMKEHFKFCNHCGAMMLDAVMTEDEEEADEESGN